MHQYLNTIELVKRHGVHKGDRTNTGTQSHFGQQKRYSLRNNNLPVVTTKKIHLKSIIHELFWMISGDTRVDYLIENGVRIWNEWVKPETAVYRELTYEETEKAIQKHIGGKYQVSFHAIAERPGIEITHIDDYRERFNIEPPLAEDGKDLIVSVNTRDYGKYRNEVPHLSYHEQFMYIIHSMLIGKPRKLIGGDLGAVYGKVWRDLEDVRIIPKLEWSDYEKRGFEFVVDIPGVDYKADKAVVKRRIDQLADVIDQLKNNPDSRRIIVCAWAPHLVDEQALPPCHSFFQFWTREMTFGERYDWMVDNDEVAYPKYLAGHEELEGEAFLDHLGIPRRALSCQLYQR